MAVSRAIPPAPLKASTSVRAAAAHRARALASRLASSPTPLEEGVPVEVAMVVVAVEV
jgi:hypothetical protein